MKAKVKRQTPDTSHIQMKRAGIVAGVTLHKGKWQTEREKEQIPGQPKPNRKGAKHPLPPHATEQIILAKAGGKSWDQTAQEFGVTKNLVAKRAKEHFINNRQGKEILKSVLLENGIAMASQASEKIEELNGMQSVVAAGIMTQRFIDLDKHTQNSPETIDLDEVAKVGRAIQELEQHLPTIEQLGLPDDIIDIT